MILVHPIDEPFTMRGARFWTNLSCTNLSQFVCVIFRSYAVLYLFNENVIIYQAVIYVLKNLNNLLNFHYQKLNSRVRRYCTA